MNNARRSIYICILILALSVPCEALRAQQSGQAPGTTSPAQPESPAANPQQELPATNDPKEIIRRSLDVDRENFDLARNYTYEERVELKVRDTKGNSKTHELYTNDVSILYGEPYERRIRKDDKPLSEKDEKKEQEKLDKFAAKHKDESEKDRAKRLAKKEKERQEEHAFVQDVINAYDFKLVGEETIDGRPAYVIEANPRKDFHPTQPHAGILSKLRGKAWIDQKDYGWIKAEADTLDTISFGFFLMRIHKGTHMSFEQTRVNDEIWLPRHILVNASARFMLLMNPSFDFESKYSNYKKFTTGVRILPGVSEVQPSTAK